MRGRGSVDAHEWDAVYAGDGRDARRWSGAPNGALVDEVADLAPGTALDVGCGEGADAIWLAQRGWRVTAIDPSRLALDRAEAAARAAGVEVDWVHAGLLEVPGGTGVHDLVSAQYAVLRHREDGASIAALLGAVAPGGTLLVVHHDLTDHDDHACHSGHGGRAIEADRSGPQQSDGAGHRFDPAEYVLPGDLGAHLDDGWEIEVDEVRGRSGPLPPDALHVRDVVLRARRRTGDVTP